MNAIAGPLWRHKLKLILIYAFIIIVLLSLFCKLPWYFNCRLLFKMKMVLEEINNFCCSVLLLVEKAFLFFCWARLSRQICGIYFILVRKVEHIFSVESTWKFYPSSYVFFASQILHFIHQHLRLKNWKQRPFLGQFRCNFLLLCWQDEMRGAWRLIGEKKN